MTLKERAASAIEKINEQLQDLHNVWQKGSGSEVSDKIDRWYLRAKKQIDDLIGNEEANNFKKYKFMAVVGGIDEVVEQKINYYQNKLKVIIEELNTHPDSILAPEKYEVETRESNEVILVLLQR
ncbi:MAG: hypothetical protein IPM97_03920 [Bdellovibrionaceae bacterium]|nr:hypothetical protein [Pseudobdellovibrionaceae bacterium]